MFDLMKSEVVTGAQSAPCAHRNPLCVAPLVSRVVEWTPLNGHICHGAAPDNYRPGSHFRNANLAVTEFINALCQIGRSAPRISASRVKLPVGGAAALASRCAGDEMDRGGGVLWGLWPLYISCSEGLATRDGY